MLRGREVAAAAAAAASFGALAQGKFIELDIAAYLLRVCSYAKPTARVSQKTAGSFVFEQAQSFE